MAKFRYFLLPLRGLLLAALTLSAAAGGLYLYLERFLPPEQVRAALEDGLSRFLERRLTIESVEWKMVPPGLTGYNVRLFESDGKEMAVSPKVRVWLSLASFRRKGLAAERVVFLSPRIVLRRRSDGDTDLARMVRQVHGRMREGRAMGEGKTPVAFRHFAIRSGRLLLMDERFSAEPLAVSLLLDADGDLEGEPGNRTFPFQLNARVEAGKAWGPLSLKGRLGKGEGMRVSTTGLPLSVFSAQVPWLKPWKGDISFSGGWDIGERDGSLSGRLKDVSPAQGPPGMALSGDFRFLRRSTSTASLVLVDQGTEARLEVTVAPWQDRSAWIVFTSSSADLNHLMDRWVSLRPEVSSSSADMVSASTSPIEASASMPDGPLWRIEAALDLRDARFRGESLEGFSATLLRDREGTLSLRDLHASAFGGSLTAAATFYASAGESPQQQYALPSRFRLSWRLEDLDVGRLSETFRIKRVFSGMGSSSGTLEGAWPVADWTRMDGDVSFEVRDGVVWGLPGMVTAFSHLNLTSLFDRSGEDAEGGLPFRRASGRAELLGGRILLSEPVRFENKTLQVAFAGEVDPSRQTVDAAIVLHFLTVFSEVLRAVPGLGTVLMAGRKSLFPVVVRVKGPLSSPEFDYQAARSLLAPFWTPFRRPPGAARKSISPPAAAPSEGRE